MELKWLYLAAAVLFALPALILIVRAIRNRSASPLIPAAMWLCISTAGVLQFMMPNLGIDGSGGSRAFLIPERLNQIPPNVLVDQEKKLAGWSAFLMIVGALGLGTLYYWGGKKVDTPQDR